MNPHDNARPNYDPNALVDFQQYQKVKKDATHTAIHVIAMSPEGVIDGTKATALTVVKHPFTGTVFVIGLLTLPTVVVGFLIAAIAGAFAPAKIAETAPVEQRLGNAIGRATNAVTSVGWTVTKPAVGSLLVNYYGGQDTSGNASLATPSQNIPGVVQVSTLGSISQSPNPQLTEEQQKAIENFLK